MAPHNSETSPVTLKYVKSMPNICTMYILCISLQRLDSHAATIDTMTTATLISVLTGQTVRVRATTDHPDSHYGMPVWVDQDNQAYTEVGSESPWYRLTDIKEEVGQ